LLAPSKQWAEDRIREGFSIIDLGDPNGINEFSAFYAMEKSMFFGANR
jgi:hypothetical protein